MCIFQAAYNGHNKHGVTSVELIIAIIIIGIIAGISAITWQAQLENEYADNAKTILTTVWQAEQGFYSWKNRYTDDWPSLDIKNPNNADQFYEYRILEATAATLLIKATRKGQVKGFTINQDGQISSF